MVTPKSKYKTYKELLAAGSAVRASILANVYADDLVHRVLPQAQVLQLDSQANVFQPVEVPPDESEVEVVVHASPWRISMRERRLRRRSGSAH